MLSYLLSSGSNAHGQLSNGSLDDSHEFHPCLFYGCPPGELPPQTRRVRHIARGANHTLILLETYDQSGGVHRELWGCGDGESGQLGMAYQGDLRARNTSIFSPIGLPLEQEGLQHYQIKALAASWETTYIALSCADKEDAVISMGSDDFGDLGIGRSKKGKERQETPSFHVISFDDVKIDGMSVDTKSIVILSLAAGQHHVVVHLQATLNNGSSRRFTVGWGTSRHGQLGNEITQGGKMPPFVSIPQVVSSDDPGDPIISTSLGSQHTIFLHASGRVTALGSNRKGQLQGMESVKGGTKLGCTWNSTYVLVQSDDGNTRMDATRSHSNGQLGRAFHDSSEFPSLAPVDFPFSLNSRRIIDMACGSEHVLALVSLDHESTEVWGWGWNEHGNLGTGLTENVDIPVRVWPREPNTEASCQKAVGIWAGSGTSWIYITNDVKE